MTREELREHCERQIQQFERVEKLMPVTLNDWKRYEEHKLILELLEQESCGDCISRKAALEKAKSYNTDGYDMYTPLVVDVEDIEELPSVTPQMPKCKDCKWWKDSDGKYRRDYGAESQCPINCKEVFEGNGYCFLFKPQESEDNE